MLTRRLIVLVLASCATSLVIAQQTDTIEMRIAKFWNVVKQNEQSYFNDELATSESYDSLARSIRQVDDGLDAIILTNLIKGKRRLIITSYGNEKLFKLADRVVSRAPPLRFLVPYSLFPHIPDIIPFIVDDVALELKDIKVHFDGAIGGKYDLMLLLPYQHRVKITYDTTGEYYKTYRHLAFLYMLQLFGERLMADKINSFDLYEVNVAISDVSLVQFYDRIR